MLTQTTFQTSDAYTLENQALRAVILPAHGGKVVSLVHKDTGFELLFQNPKEQFTAAPIYANFEEYEGCGFDDAFPNVDEETVMVGGQAVRYPDHGEIWTASFDAKAEGEQLHLRFESPLLGYVYHKTFRLDGQGLMVDYRIENPRTVALPAIWTCHCLVRCEPEMQLLLPAEVSEVENVFEGDWLGVAEGDLTYPIAQTPKGEFDLRKMPPSGTLKYYVKGELKQGECGYWYPQSGMKALLRYDPEALPYLGFWCTSGGFRGDINCALEPTTGYYDSVTKATRKGKCSQIAAGGKMEFTLGLYLEPEREGE